MTGLSYSKTYIGNKTDGFTTAPKNAAFTGVNITLDNDTEVFVGAEGNVLEVSLPVCNSTEDAEAYGEYILSALTGYQYQPYASDGTLLNPAFQLGDGVTIRSVYSGVYSRDTKMGRLTKADISAPYPTEVNNEYPFKNGEKKISYRKYKRLETSVESELSIHAGEISAKVSQLSPTGQTAFSWSLTSNGHYWYNNGNEVMSITSNGLTVRGRISALSGYIGSETNGFTVGSTSISNGKTSLSDSNSGIYIGTDGISLGNSDGNGGTSYFKVDSQGNATVKNLTVLGQMTFKDSYSSTPQSRTASACYGGIGGGVGFNNSQTSSGRVSYFYCGTLTANNIWFGDTNQLYIDSSGYVRAQSW